MLRGSMGVITLWRAHVYACTLYNRQWFSLHHLTLSLLSLLWFYIKTCLFSPRQTRTNRRLSLSSSFYSSLSSSIVSASSPALWATVMNKDGSYKFQSPWKRSTPRDLRERSWRPNLWGMFRHAPEERGTAMPLSLSLSPHDVTPKNTLCTLPCRPDEVCMCSSLLRR